MHSKSKHFKLDLHFVRDNVQNHMVQLVHIPNNFQVVVPLTKLVSSPTFLRVRHKFKVALNPTISLYGVLGSSYVTALPLPTWICLYILLFFVDSVVLNT